MMPWAWYVRRRLLAEAGEGGDAGAGAAAGAAGNAAGQGDPGGAGGDNGGSGAGEAGNGGADGADGASGAPATWPEDWRDRYAKGDTKKQNVLSRYASPEAVFDAHLSLQQRISAGELRSAIPKDATPEKVAAWRAENGIPEAPEKYDLTFEDGLVIGENDKPIIDGFLKYAHDQHYTNAQAKQAVKWYYDHLKEVEATHVETTKRLERETEDALRAEWGEEFRGNQNAIEALLDANLKADDKELRDKILNGAKQNAGFARLLAAVALQINPASTMIGGLTGGGNLGKAIEDEIAAIEKDMRTNRAEYNRDERKQERYRLLLEARQKRQGNGQQAA